MIDQFGRVLRETLNRMDHLPGRISEEMIRKALPAFQPVEAKSRKLDGQPVV
jgi:hypothetical protein